MPPGGILDSRQIAKAQFERQGSKFLSSGCITSPVNQHLRKSVAEVITSGRAIIQAESYSGTLGRFAGQIRENSVPRLHRIGSRCKGNGCTQALFSSRERHPARCRSSPREFLTRSKKASSMDLSGFSRQTALKVLFHSGLRHSVWWRGWSTLHMRGCHSTREGDIQVDYVQMVSF